MRIVINTQTKIKNNLILLLLSLITTSCASGEAKSNFFNEVRAFESLKKQTEIGSRVPGSRAHAKTIEYIARKMNSAGWQVEFQTQEFNEIEITNLIAQAPKSVDNAPYILLGAHYDYRMKSDSDPRVDNHETPVPGANDGASGVAALLEIARVLPRENDECIRFAFFDAEDNGNIDNWNWIMGSRYFVTNLTEIPFAVVILDMVGDADLNIYKEENSDPGLTDEIWQTAHSLGYEQYFIDSYKYRIFDDHVPFLEVGIPAVDIIDFDYPYWHTVQDTPDKTSSHSLRIVGKTIIHWLNEACQDLGY